MTADMRAVFWLLGAVLFIGGLTWYALALGIAALGGVLMWWAR